MLLSLFLVLAVILLSIHGKYQRGETSHQVLGGDLVFSHSLLLPHHTKNSLFCLRNSIASSIASNPSSLHTSCAMREGTLSKVQINALKNLFTFEKPPCSNHPPFVTLVI